MTPGADGVETGGRRGRRRGPVASVGTAAVAAGAALYGAIVFGPVALLGVRALASARDPSAAAVAWPGSGRLELLARSGALALAVAAAGTLAGFLVATALWRRGGAAGRLRWLVVALAPVPAYVHALAWSEAATAAGRTAASLGLPAPPLSGPVAAWWVQMIADLPLAIALSLVALETVPPELVDAARVQGSDGAALLRVAAPLAAPMAVAGAGLLFLLSLLDYSIPVLYQVPVYSLALFADYSARGDAARAFLYAVPMLVMAAAVVAGSQAGVRRAGIIPKRGGRPAAPLALPGWLRLAQLAALAVAAAQILVPVVLLSAAVGSVSRLAATASAAAAEIGLSFLVAVAAAAVAVPLALVPAQRLARSRCPPRWWLAVTIPLALPAPLVGIGLIAVWGSGPAGAVYDSPAMPVLAAVARFAPWAALVLVAALRRTDPSLIDAARVFQRRPLAGWLGVHLPLMLPGVAAAAAVVFALSLGELGATLLVAPPGRETLTMRIFNYMHYGASDTVAGLCLILSAGAIVAGTVAAIALAATRRLGGPAVGPGA